MFERENSRDLVRPWLTFIIMVEVTAQFVCVKMFAVVNLMCLTEA